MKEGRGRETRKGDGIPFISGRRGGGWLSSRLNTKTSFNSSFDDSLSLPSVRLFPASTPFPPPIFFLSAPHQARNLARPVFLCFFPSYSLFSSLCRTLFLWFHLVDTFIPCFPVRFIVFFVFFFVLKKKKKKKKGEGKKERKKERKGKKGRKEGKK